MSGFHLHTHDHRHEHGPELAHIAPATQRLMRLATYASVAPPAIRGSVAALVYLAVLVGAAAAPLAFGFVNDWLSVRHGEQAVRYTLLLAPALLVLSAISFRIARRTVEKDTTAAESLPI